MRTWIRVPTARLCGKCGEAMPAGAPAVLLTFGAISKVRCEACAGKAPPDLPPIIERAPRVPTTMAPVQSLSRMLPLDWRPATVGVTREPGEDDA